MKITTIRTLVCHARMRNWIFVKIETDQPGLFGWGKATLEWHTRAVVGAAEDLAQLLIGGFRIEKKGRLVFPSERPGLGVKINEAEVAKHPFEQEVPRRSYGRDGSVIDW